MNNLTRSGLGKTTILEKSDFPTTTRPFSGSSSIIYLINIGGASCQTLIYSRVLSPHYVGGARFCPHHIGSSRHDNMAGRTVAKTAWQCIGDDSMVILLHGSCEGIRLDPNTKTITAIMFI